MSLCASIDERCAVLGVLSVWRHVADYIGCVWCLGVTSCSHLKKKHLDEKLCDHLYVFEGIYFFGQDETVFFCLFMVNSLL